MASRGLPAPGITPFTSVGPDHLGSLDARVLARRAGGLSAERIGFGPAWRGVSARKFSHPMGMASRTGNDHKQPIRVRSEQRQRRVMLAARVNSEEERRIREAAKARNVSVASLIRDAVLSAVERSPAA